MRLGLTALVLACALAALIVSAGRTPSRRRTTRLVLTAGETSWISCKNPNPLWLAACLEATKEEKALEKQIRANGRPATPYPAAPYLALQPVTGRR